MSHKNCKGIVKGIANAASLARERQKRERPVYLSGEDLANVGPIALFQDLAMMAALGIELTAWNSPCVTASGPARQSSATGTITFKGLSAWPGTRPKQVMLENHGDHADKLCVLTLGGDVRRHTFNEECFVQLHSSGGLALGTENRLWGIKDGALDLSSLNSAPFGRRAKLQDGTRTVSALERVDPNDSKSFLRAGMAFD